MIAAALNLRKRSQTGTACECARQILVLPAIESKESARKEKERDQ